MRQVDRFDDRANDWRPPAKSSFVEEHVRSMDVCYHPERQPVHGFTAWPGPRPGWLFPMFTSTTTSMHSDLLVPPLEQYYDFPLGDEGWEKKKFDTVFWRGSTTGADLTNPHMRKWSQRVRLCQSAFQALPLDSVTDDEAVPQSKGSITLPYSPSDNGRRPGAMSTFTADKGTLAKKWFDFQFQGQPTQCGDAEACKEFEKQFEWAGFVPQKQQSAYKYLIDVDGNGWSGRFHRLMLTTSAVLKATVFPEWYADHIQPWVQSVPSRLISVFRALTTFDRAATYRSRSTTRTCSRSWPFSGATWKAKGRTIISRKKLERLEKNGPKGTGVWPTCKFVGVCAAVDALGPDHVVFSFRLKTFIDFSSRSVHRAWKSESDMLTRFEQYNRAMNRDPNDPRSMSLA